MASPQKEKGYTAIANELIEAFMRFTLSPYEWQVLWVIIRLSYGWNKKGCNITYAELEQMTGLKRRHIQRAIKMLVTKNVITVETIPRQASFFALQKDYEKWNDITLYGKERTRGKSRLTTLSGYRDDLKWLQENTLSGYRKIPKVVTEISRKPNTDKDLPMPKDIYKDIYKDISLKERLFEIWKKQFPNISIPKKIPTKKIDYFLYKTEKGEINITKIRNITAYIKSLTVEEFPNLIERENQRIAKLKEEAERKAKEKEWIASIDIEENKKKIREIITVIGGTC